MKIQMTTNKRPHRHEDLWMSGKWNRKDRKSNLHHNATFNRESHKRNRELKYRVLSILYECYTWGFDPYKPHWFNEDSYN